MLRRIPLFLILLCATALLAGCSGGPGMPDAGPVPGLNASGTTGPTTGTTTGANPNAGGATGATLQTALTPGTPPSVPANPPPVVPGAFRQDRSLPLGFNLNAGWNVLSFPVSRLTSASGFQYQLYYYNQGAWVAVDPVNNPAGVDTRLAFLAYADQAVTVHAEGEENTGEVTTVPLNQGWNLLGCPRVSALPYASMSATRVATTRRLDEVAGAGLSVSEQWLLSSAYGLNSDGSLFLEDLRGPTGLQPFQARWVFAWSEAELNLNVAPAQPPPTILRLSAAAVNPGDTLTISGSGFGPVESGLVSLGGANVPGTALQSWSDTQIVLTVPASAQSGNVVVFVNRFPSLPSLLTVGTTGSGVASLSGLVRSTAGAPLAGVQVLLDTGQTALTGGDGTFSITEIPAGDHLVFAQALGYRQGFGLISFAAGDSRSVLVELSPLTGGGGGSGGGGSGSGSTTGRLTFFVNAYPFTQGGKRYFVSRILVNEYGNYSNRWTDTYVDIGGSTPRTLRCEGAYQGRQYIIRVTWTSDADSNDTQTLTTYRTIYTAEQNESFYNP